MATKLVFHPSDTKFYTEEMISFEYVQGLAFSQKQKNVDSLRRSILWSHPEAHVLEVSTKSRDKIGIACSAFNLHIDGHCLESAFQAGKVFEGVGGFPEAANLSPKEARDYVKEHCGAHSLVGFHYMGHDFPLEPKTFFYDWLYVNALVQSKIDLAYAALYDTFTDIEFNEKKQVNCQARSTAIAVSLQRKGLLEQALKSPQNFLTIVYR
jgi:hypothetical protein